MARNKSSILYLSTFPPRECGIATFSQDLLTAMNKKFNPIVKSRVLAINNESTDFYRYGDSVVEHISASNIEDYLEAVQKINNNPAIKLVHIQHEFGIFGGDWGDHLIPFVKLIEKPVVVTFHSVLSRPEKDLLRMVRFIAEHAQALIVMGESSKKILANDYGIEQNKIHVVPHGIPYVAFGNGEKEKQLLGLEGKTILSTFGLLSSGKGIEYAIRALPRVVKQFPDVVYLVIGETHPIVRKEEGERYRTMLEKEVRRLGLNNHVKFYNKYLSLEELVTYLKATDVYLSPYLEKRQAASGTIAYALGCGRPVVSTDSLYAKEVVTPGRGILVPMKKPHAMQEAILQLLEDPAERKAMAHCAYTETRNMTWPNVAISHFKLYNSLAQLEREKKFPRMTLKHMQRLTDEMGIIQFARYTKPDLRYGYCLDDNARALMVASDVYARNRKQYALNLAEQYLNFIEYVQKKNGAFSNLVDAKKTIDKHSKSEDAYGRALWALGYVMNTKNLPKLQRDRAENILRKALPHVKTLRSSRALAFSLLGLYWADQAGSHGYKTTMRELAEIQMRQLHRRESGDWIWFEDSLTYSNSKLPESLLYAYAALGKKKYLDAAERSLQFLTRITFEKNHFSPIGQAGWYFKEGRRAYFDQQPEDASSMVQTLIAAYEITKKPHYKKNALAAFEWFLGENHLNQMVYDEVSGGCHDGLGRYSLNMNQGAESTISYLLARVAVDKLSKKII